ncbi:MAG: hypothetical protein QGF00_16875 [Planctomycetota bacterium]|jgi:hypothetical protein|nr:hypothetical protein [Planctomycetota bacterium]MDP7251283.1 hypothetical protein [Planctomycetota bacterium]
MTWSIDSEYVNGTIVERSVNNDKFETTFMVMSKDGNLLLHGTAENTRKREEL